MSSIKTISNIEWPDYLVIALHFALTVAVGLWAARRGSRGTATGYFLAGRDMSWYLVGASLYVSNIGSTSFMGIGGAAAANGIAVVCYEFTGLFIIQLLGFVFMPVYLASGVYTTPEYVRRRFGGRRCNVYLAVQNLIMFVFTKLSAEIYAGALIIQYTLGWDKYLSVLVLLACTALYTIVGGLASVIFTDALQTIVIVVGATILSVMSLIKVGGYEEMLKQYRVAVSSPDVLLSNDTCGEAPDNFNHIFRPASDPNYPWPGVLIGANILSYWYFCTDQVLVQRLLSAKNTVHAKAGSIMAGYMKILPLFLMAWPGIISRVLYPDIVACGTAEECKAACGIEAGCSNFAYVSMVIGIMPTGLRGVMLAAMLAALMSSLTSIFNSGSTLFTLDLWSLFRKKASEKEIMIVSRVFTLVFVGVSIAWLPMLDRGQGGQLFNYLQSISSYMSPPIGAVYLMGIMTTRANEKGAFWGMLIGFILGTARMIADWALPAPTCGEVDTRPWIVAGVHYLHYAIFLFGVSLLVIWCVSIISEPPEAKLIYRTTWWTKNQLIKEFEPELKDDEKEDEEEEEYDKGRVDSVLNALDQATRRKSMISRASSGDDLDQSTSSDTREVANEQSGFSMKSCLLSWFCGIEQNVEEGEDKAAARRLALLSTKESRLGKWVVNINLVILLIFGIFIWGFFA